MLHSVGSALKRLCKTARSNKLSTARGRSHKQQISGSRYRCSAPRKVAFVRSGFAMISKRWCALSLGALLAALPLFAHQSIAGPRYMRVHGQAAPPYGFVQFCQSFTAECISKGFDSRRFQASPDRLSELDEVNRKVNEAVIPATDNQVYGVEEFWTFPGAMGDCEDYVVLKRKMLMERGWPAGAVLITVVLDEKGEGHAVLTARTAQGDFILDNKDPEVKLWTSTPYRYVMRQSYINPKIWMSLDPSATASPQALAGLNTR